MKPRVFVGSSTEGLEVAEALNLRLSKDCETVFWSTVFGVSETYIGALEKVLDDVEFAILVITPDDLREKRGEPGRVPRDNVIFELGLFVGRLGRERTFFVCDPEAVQLPSDLLGVEPATIESDWVKRDVDNAVLPAATKILRAIRQAPRIARGMAGEGQDRLFADVDALYTALVAWPAIEGHEIVINIGDTTWAWKLVPTLIHWRLNGVRVRVHVPPLQLGAQARAAEAARQTLLRELGCEVSDRSNAGVSGFFFRTQYWDESEAIVLNDDRIDSDAPLATRYEGGADASAVQALYEKLPPSPSQDVAPPFVPRLVAQDPAEVMALLRKGVPQYREAKIELDSVTVRTSELLPLSTYARAYKYRQIERLFSAYRKADHEPFAALAVDLMSGKRSILTPPVVELRDDGPVIIEGTTRAAYCHTNDIARFHCIAVTGVTEPLPGDPMGIEALTISERSLSQLERTENFQGSLFRQIERATHPY